jgi:prophage antirepressor-like protein
MNTQIQIFKNSQFGEVRVTEIDGKTYFVGIDVAKSLGYVDPKGAISRHCKGALIQRLSDNQGVPHDYLVITESDVYRLILRSNTERAEKFQEWVCGEVLPAIHKHGGYMAAHADETPEEIMARALVVAQDTINRQKQRVQILEGTNAHLESEVKQLAPKAEYTDRVLQSTSTYTMTQVAKELGMSEKALEGKLHTAGVVFRQSGQWMLYSLYQGEDYSKTRTHHFNYSDGTPGTNIISVWTERGRAFVHQLFKGGVL